MQFTIVSDVPLDSSGAFCATSVEKSGESAITTSPQKKRKAISNETELVNKNSGERQQHEQDKNNEMVASFFAPKRWESNPLNTQAKPPDAMTMNDNNGTFNSAR